MKCMNCNKEISACDYCGREFKHGQYVYCDGINNFDSETCLKGFYMPRFIKISEVGYGNEN